MRDVPPRGRDTTDTSLGEHSSREVALAERWLARQGIRYAETGAWIPNLRCGVRVKRQDRRERGEETERASDRRERRGDREKEHQTSVAKAVRADAAAHTERRS